MRSKILFRLSSEESTLVDQFCRQVGVDRTTVAKKALFMVMNQAYAQAAKLKEEMEKNASESTDTGGDMGSLPIDSQTGNSDVPTESSQV